MKFTEFKKETGYLYSVSTFFRVETVFWSNKKRDEILQSKHDSRAIVLIAKCDPEKKENLERFTIAIVEKFRGESAKARDLSK